MDAFILLPPPASETVCSRKNPLYPAPEWIDRDQKT